ncbi:hypothetical protein J3E71DRAFT_365754 [Bipolaris maydis]|nr:hypothetical protein J3E71DRAFT_365754 [Bipolaris maydis]
MQFSITAILFGLVAISSAAITDVEGVRNTPRSVIEARQEPNGSCCFPNRSLKQDACTVNGGPLASAQWRSNCVANNHWCGDQQHKERSGVLCRFKAADGKIQDGISRLLACPRPRSIRWKDVGRLMYVWS